MKMKRRAGEWAVGSGVVGGDVVFQRGRSEWPAKLLPDDPP